jgi:CheY-like chemotaxis protein
MQKKFLLVDDDVDDAMLFREALAEIDKSIIFYNAFDGQEAFHKLNSKTFEEPDLIFLDINMPVMNGWEFLFQLKRDTSYEHLPVIMFSTSPDKRNVDKALDMGALCFFTKPDEYTKLKEILSVVVRNDNPKNMSKAISIFNDVQTRKVFACS